MPISTRSKTTLKPVSKAEWNAVEALLLLKKTLVVPAVAARPHRKCASYKPGTFTGMDDE
jgi:hypothetical protein